jgi:flagellar basal-body rod protein FlgB
MSGLIDPAMTILTGAIDGLANRQAIISGNLANLDTPGYQPKTIDFETELKRQLDSMNDAPSHSIPNQAGPSADTAMKTTNPRHFAALASVGDGASSSISATAENLRNDNNKVDLETEMTALTQTQIKFSADSRLMSSKFAQLYSVLGGH